MKSILIIACAISFSAATEAKSQGNQRCKFVANYTKKPVWNDRVLGKSGPHDVGDYEQQIKGSLRYTSCTGKVYVVPNDTVVNGASIPRGAWTALGYTPWSGPLEEPSILHDYLCGMTAETSDKVHELFYETLSKAPIPRWKARAMYFAVKNFGPQWNASGNPANYPTYVEALMKIAIRLFRRNETIILNVEFETPSGPDYYNSNTRVPVTVFSLQKEEQSVWQDANENFISDTVRIDQIFNKIKNISPQDLNKLARDGSVRVRGHSDR